MSLGGNDLTKGGVKLVQLNITDIASHGSEGSFELVLFNSTVLRGVRLQLLSNVEVTVLSTLVDASQHLIRFGLLRQVVQLVDELRSRDIALLATIDELK